jgi:hypothetical protein
LKEPFITGSGNDFSICFQVNIAGGSSALFNFPFAYVVSGTLDGNKIKGLRIADFGLKTTADTQGNSVEGNVTLYSDGDGSSEKLP